MEYSVTMAIIQGRCGILYLTNSQLLYPSTFSPSLWHIARAIIQTFSSTFIFRCSVPPPSVLGCMPMSDRSVIRALFDVLAQAGAVWVAMFLSEAFLRKFAMGVLTIVAAGCSLAGLVCFGLVIFVVEMTIAKACVISVLVVVYMYSLEIYGTASRATAFSLLWAVGILGAIVSIFIGYAFQKSMTALLIILGLLLVLVLLPGLFLPKDVKDIDDIEYIQITN